MSDECVVDANLLRCRDEQSWDQLYQLTCRQTYRVLYCVTGASASELEELNQDVWLSAIAAVEQFDPTRGTAGDWVLGIARYKGLSYLRKQYRRKLVYVGDSPDSESTEEAIDAALEAVERVAILRSAIASLPEHWQYILQRKYNEGMRVTEIANLIGTTPKSVESILSRSRQRLRELIAETI